MSEFLGKSPRARTVTLSLLADQITEEKILEAFDKWNTGIKGSAYILHDQDFYCEKDVRNFKKRYDEIKATGADPDFEIPELGDKKPAHWHILLDFGSSGRTLSSIASVFGTSENMVQKVHNGTKGFVSMMAYLTHISVEAMQDGKHAYDFSEVKGFRLPAIPSFRGVNSYEDFAKAYEDGLVFGNNILKQVLQGKMIPRDIMEQYPDDYVKNDVAIDRMRARYVRDVQPMPRHRFNYYVGSKYGVGSGKTTGRIGKSVISQMLAITQLQIMYPEVDFTGMTPEELEKQGFVFYAGGKGVSLDKYDGQPVVIWEDARGYDLVKIFGGVNQLFQALDINPKPIGLNVKYGRVVMKNSVNIFNGSQNYDEFISDLSQAYRDEEDQWGHTRAIRYTKEDKSQAVGRFPFFILVSPETIEVGAQLQYLLGTNRFDFQATFKNHARLIAQQNLIGVEGGQMFEGFMERQQKIEAGTYYDLDNPPDEWFEKLSDDSDDKSDKLYHGELLY